ncbi:MAG: carboxynorspermidine decarboxylase [bacterium]|nr:carboxynorspermidine decarboxylase [bacterium]
MNWEDFRRLDLKGVPTPIHIIDEVALTRNLEILRDVQKRTGARIILALKAFAQFSVFDLIRKHLPGATASSLSEARLAYEEYTDCGATGGEVHICAPAYSDGEFDELLKYGDHIVFNSFSQWDRFRERVIAYNDAARAAGAKTIECALRLNPEHSEGEVPLYDPCAPGSRLGTRWSAFEARARENNLDLDDLLEGLDGLHFHTLCEQNVQPLERTLAAVEKKFGRYLKKLKWINFGGGHHITRPDYDVERLCNLILDFRRRNENIEVYLEPGEAVVLGTGVLVSRVLDIVPGEPGEFPSVILDTSATAHMPDTLEMPYRAEILGAGEAGRFAHSYRLGGLTCLAGDVIGEYSFENELSCGEELIFLDMSHYTMVKNTCFNGVGLPAIATANTHSGELSVAKVFGYESYRDRLS